MTEEQIEWLKNNIELSIEKKHWGCTGELILIELVIAGDIISSRYVDIKE